MEKLATVPDDRQDRGVGDRLVEQWKAAAGREREEIFRQIYVLFYRQVYRYFVRRGFVDDESRDLTQDTFVKVSEGLESFRGESRFVTWLFKVAANVYRNRLRTGSTLKRTGHEVPLDAADGDDPSAAPAAGIATGEPGALECILGDERSKLLRDAMQGLPLQMRRCVLLRVTQDLKYREIADVLQVTVDTVKAHLYQARQQLKGKLGDYFEDLNV